MAEAPVTVQRQKDGRHAVMDAKGAVLGLHKSPWSAARQLHDYYGAQEDMEAKNVGGKQSSILQHPHVPKPGEAHPVVPTPKIPKP